MFFWSGLGFLVPLLAFACFLLMEVAVEGATGDTNYYQARLWPMAAAFALAALFVGVLANRLDRRQARTLVDEATGERVVLRTSHTFFFIPVRYWSGILLVTGAGVVLAEVFGQ